MNDLINSLSLEMGQVTRPAQDIEFILGLPVRIGAVAVAFYAEPRFTRDIDLLKG